ncbi:hypothetical protein EV383_4365 [Pseudonocardia sediminis]|uniref:Uncharacterized protein n=1 Tax=Pseudonocardia sediminis TaxID=1397368 RepID=A0A4Q7V261_PSEST|nr:hypothetical protein [Pseudonocardia sediminis]RZT87441.1 hypothetical protein EV383_4365 [Pseudonocardia sediminis]
MSSYATHFSPPSMGPLPPQPVTAAQDPPTVLAYHDAMRIRAAATRAKTVFPDVVGEYLHDELVFYAEVGYRLERGSRMARLVDRVMTAPIPGSP